MTDESGQSYPGARSTRCSTTRPGPLGYYGVFTANMHTDSAASDPGSDAIVAVGAGARRAGRVREADAAPGSTDATRRRSAALTYSGHVLGFNVVAGATANGLEAMLPLTSGDGAPLSTITRGAVNVPFTAQTIKGVAYAMFAADPGSYAATYTPDTTPPAISARDGLSDDLG